ncbi:MAG: histidine kinase [Akkermansiaceae bacterium]
MNAALKNARKVAACFLLVWFSALHPARAGLEIGDGALPPTEVFPHLSVLLDPTAALGIGEVLAGEGSGFKHDLSRAPSFGVTRAAVWLKFDLRSVADRERTVRVEVETARMSEFTWYVVANGSVQQTQDSGAAAADRPASRLPRIELRIPPGETRSLYARASSDTSLWLPLRAGSPEAMERRGLLHAGLEVLRIGIAGALAFSCVLLGALHRQKLYFHLAALVTSYAVYQAIFNGYVRMIWPEVPMWVEREGFGVNSALGVYFLMAFNQSFLLMKQAARSARVPQRMAEALCLLAAAAFLMLDYYDSVRLFHLLLISAVVLSCVAVVLRVFQMRTAVEFWYLVAWLLFGLPLALFGLQFSGVLLVTLSFSRIQGVMIPAILMGFFLAVLTRQKKLQGLELSLAEAQQAESDAQFNALRYQINPHFLFNTLNSIDALSRTAPQLVPNLVSKLATFLRLRLAPSPNRLASFGQELETVRSYLDIERVRFGEALVATYDIHPESLHCLVPEFLLQPLAENAVKYGFENDRDVQLHLEAHVAANKIVITITNRGSLAAPPGAHAAGLGLGTENIRQRLALHYGAGANLQISEEGESVVARLEIPIEESKT